MKNHKQLLMDFYLNLLMLSQDNSFRIKNQDLYAHIRDCLADELETSSHNIQNIFERMVREDQ